jgi:hypothetical protein
LDARARAARRKTKVNVLKVAPGEYRAEKSNAALQ